MLGEGLGGDDPGDLGQPVRLDVGPEPVEEALARTGVGAGAGLVVQGVARSRAAVPVEVEQRVVAVVAAVGVRDPAPAPVRVEAVADVLVDLPGDPGLLQTLGVRRPAVPLLVVAQHRAAARAVVAGVPRPHVVAIGVGGTDERAVVGVADGEGVRERVVEGDVVAGQVRHRGRGLGGHPPVVPAAVERAVPVVPAVREVLDEGQAQVVGVGVEGQDVLRAVGLPPDRPAVLGDGAGVAETADPSQRAEVMVEGTVLLHQDDDVLDIVQRSGAVVGGQGGRTLDAAGQRGERRGGAGELQETPPVDFGHG